MKIEISGVEPNEPSIDWLSKPLVVNKKGDGSQVVRVTGEGDNNSRTFAGVLLSDGEYATNWIKSSFKLFTDKITLSNE
jgi:hypothetical protein